MVQLSTEVVKWEAGSHVAPLGQRAVFLLDLVKVCLGEGQHASVVQVLYRVLCSAAEPEVLNGALRALDAVMQSAHRAAEVLKPEPPALPMLTRILVDASDPLRARLAAGVLISGASHTPQLRTTIAQFPVEDGYTGLLLKGLLAGPGALDSHTESQTLLRCLSAAFAVRRAQLLDSFQCSEARVNCAVAGVLISMLVHEDPVAYKVVVESVGDGEVMLDMLREFAIFQDRCGALTNASLVSLHAAMLSVEAHQQDVSRQGP